MHDHDGFNLTVMNVTLFLATFCSYTRCGTVDLYKTVDQFISAEFLTRNCFDSKYLEQYINTLWEMCIYAELITANNLKVRRIEINRTFCHFDFFLSTQIAVALQRLEPL